MPKNSRFSVSGKSGPGAVFSCLLVLVVIISVVLGYLLFLGFKGREPSANLMALREAGGGEARPMHEGGSHNRGAVIAEPRIERHFYLDGPEGDPEQHWADLYLPGHAGPQAAEKSLPLIALIHGGAWRSNLGADIFGQLAKDLSGAGFAVFNLEYRRLGTDGGWPETFADVGTAIDYIPELFAQHPEIDSARSNVAGHSSGAQLAVRAATRSVRTAAELGSAAALVRLPRFFWQARSICALRWHGGITQLSIFSGAPQMRFLAGIERSIRSTIFPQRSRSLRSMEQRILWCIQRTLKTMFARLNGPARRHV